jgi:hypothetical protein
MEQVRENICNCNTNGTEVFIPELEEELKFKSKDSNSQKTGDLIILKQLSAKTVSFNFKNKLNTLNLFLHIE